MKSFRALLLLGAMVLTGACVPTEFHVGGESTAAAESGRLRALVAQLQKDHTALTDRLAASEKENAGLRRTRDGRTLPPGIVPPVAATLELDGISGPVSTDQGASLNAQAKGLVDTLRLYVMPYDQEHRLLPVAGTARVRVLALDKNGKLGKLIAEKAWDAATFAKTWRDNITGIHFRLEVPLPKSLSDAFTAQVEVTDQVTGTVLKVEKAFVVRKKK